MFREEFAHDQADNRDRGHGTAGDTGRRHWPATLAGGIWVGRALATGAPTQAPLTYAGTRTNQDGKA